MQGFNPDDLGLTLDELEEIEDLTEAPASQWEIMSQGKLMKAMLFVVRKRTNPKVKMADIGGIKVTELEAELAPFAKDAPAAT